MKPLAAVLALLGIGAAAVLLRYGTVEPCGVLREMVRQQAASQSGIGGLVAGVIPDAALDAIVAAEYGRLTPGRCVGIVIGTAGSTAPVPAKTPVASPESIEAARTAEAERNRAKLLADIAAVMAAVEQIRLKADADLPKFPNVEAKYRDITQRMQSLLDQERSTADSFQRGQISFEIRGAASFAGPMEAAHNDVGSLERDFVAAETTIVSGLNALGKVCQADSRSPALDNREEKDVLASACDDLASASDRNESVLQRMNAAFDRAEAVYLQEKRKQDMIVSEASARQ